jgi:hypothetical protein
MRTFPLMLAGIVMASPAYAYEETVTTTTMQKDVPTYSSSKTITRTTTDASAPVAVIAPAPEATVSKRVEVNRSNAMGDSSHVVTEQTSNTYVEPPKPSTVTKKTEYSETNGLGTQRKVQTSQTVNGPGYMAREEYREQRNY